MSIPVYSIVGWSGSGKTTLLEALLPALKRRGLRVAVVKHDVHGFDIDQQGKDTWRLSRAGADVVAIESAERAAVMLNRPVSPCELVGRIRDVDLILTEGFKYGPWPKIVLHRAAAGKPAPDPEEAYFAVLSDVPLTVNAPVLALEDAEALAALLVEAARNPK